MSPVLNRALVLEERVETADGAGGASVSWQALGTLWGEIRLRTGNDVRVGPALAGQGRFRITVRAAPPGAASRPRPDQRFREGTRVYRILAVAELNEAGRFLACFAEEEVPV